MPKALPTFQSKKRLSDEDIVFLVEQNIPRWKAACDHADTDMVIFHQMAFSTTPDDLFLVGIAIKYAGIAKKKVTVIS